MIAYVETIGHEEETKTISSFDTEWRKIMRCTFY